MLLQLENAIILFAIKSKLIPTENSSEIVLKVLFRL